MWRDPTLYLDDIVEHADRALGYVEGLTFDQFAADQRTRDAVILNLQIVGEAAKRVPPEIRDMAPGLAWQESARMRDRLVHGYGNVDLRIVWRVLTTELWQLRDGVRALLRELRRESGG